MNPEAIEPLTHINVNVLHAGDTHISTRLDEPGRPGAGVVSRDHRLLRRP